MSDGSLHRSPLRQLEAKPSENRELRIPVKLTNQRG
jgi:hypothetical protein